MKNQYTIPFLILLILNIRTTFCACMEEPQRELTVPTVAEHLSLTYLYNPVLPWLISLSPESISAIRTCINDPEWVRAKARKTFPANQQILQELCEAHNQRLQKLFPADVQRQQELAVTYKHRLQEVFAANEQKQHELTAAYDWLNAFLKFSKVPDLSWQLTPKTLKYINIDITRSEPAPGLSSHATLCDGKDPSLQEGLLIDHLQNQLKRLERYGVYDPKNDTLSIPKLIEFFKHAEFLAKRGINGIKIPYLEKNSRVLDEEEIHRWASEQGNAETINATQWLERHEPHFRAKTELEQRMDFLCTTVRKLTEPVDQVVALVLAIVGFRPFADGNKRTAWVVAHIICSQNDLILKPLIKGTNEYEEYHRLLDDLSTSPDSNANTENAIHDFFFKRILRRPWHPSAQLISKQSTQVIGIKKHKKRFTSFPTLFFHHPTLHGGIFFSNAQLGEALSIAQKPVEERLATMKKKYPHYWERKERQEANDWLAALLCCSALLTEEDFAQNATIPLLTKINTAVLNLAGVNKLRSVARLWNWTRGGNLHWIKEEVSAPEKGQISPQELALRVFLLVPQQTKKLIDCRVYDPDSDYIDTKELIKFFNVLCSVGTRRQILGATSFSVKGEEVTFKRVDHNEIERWAAEQNLEGKFKADKWIEKRSFEFSEPLFISWQLEKILALVRQEVNGFHKAMALFLGILDLYPYADGNKRTAQLAASIILLQHGFAPLIIDSEGAALMNAYTISRKNSPRKRDLVYQLKSYCIAQIKKYQGTVDHELGKLAATTEEMKKNAAEEAVAEFIAKAAAATEQESSVEPAKTVHKLKLAETDQYAKPIKPAKNSGKKKKRKKKKKGKR